MYGQTTLDARAEVRLASAELRLWRAEAKRRGVSVSELARTTMARAMRETDFQKLMRDLRNLMHQHAQKNLPAVVFDLTQGDELALLSATPAEVGSEVMGRLTLGGPRAAFQKIYGVKVRWGMPFRQLHASEQ